MTALKDIRIGYMRYIGENNISLAVSIDNGAETPTTNTYSKIYCGDSTSCAGADAASSCDGNYCIRNASTGIYTPLAKAIVKAKEYLNSMSNGGSYSDDKNQAKGYYDTVGAGCRKRYVIVITDGEDNRACSGSDLDGTDRTRASVVAAANDLYTAGNGNYKLFVVGFGANQKDPMRNSLNWAAYYGAGGSSSGMDYTPLTYTDGTNSKTCTNDSIKDPGSSPLSGYAYIAGSAEALKSALTSIITQVTMGNYSFAQPYISASRTEDNNFAYVASFKPQESDPLWPGYVQQYSIGASGVVTATDNEAQDKMGKSILGERKIYTYSNNVFENKFITDNTNITNAALGITTTYATEADRLRKLVFGFIRGTDNPDTWKFGDIFHSNLRLLATPSPDFTDIVDKNGSFTAFRKAHPRTATADTSIVIGGANDGQLHAFTAGSMKEAWSFIPPSSMPNLTTISHSTSTSTQGHLYMVDGPVTTSDVWLCSGSDCDGTRKSSDGSGWHSMIVFGLGRGNPNQLWSSSAICDPTGTFSAYYTTSGTTTGTTPTPYYCGYYALEATSSPSTQIDAFKWTIGQGSSAYWGEPWSKMAISRVKILGKERWVGFVGGGYNENSCGSGSCSDTRGKGLFVIDMKDGSVIASYHAMKYSVPAAPVAVDLDYDGFADTVYVGDMGGNVWRLKMCAKSSDATCGPDNTDSGWTFTKFYTSSSTTPIYTKPTLSRDSAGYTWVYWGTGDLKDPTSTASGSTGAIYGLKDGGGSYTSSDLTNTASTTYDGSTTQGWVYKFANSGEKVLADSDVYAGVVYFTSYTPSAKASRENMCASAGGTARLYEIGYVTGAVAGIVSLGTGIPSAPVISTDSSGNTGIYVATSGAGTADYSYGNKGVLPPKHGIPSIRYVRDQRVQ
jgi:type IV pilus assembly protein PilY1